MPLAAEDALLLVRVGGAAIALVWFMGLVRLRLRPSFDGQRRVEVIARAFILAGLAAVAATYVGSAG